MKFRAFPRAYFNRLSVAVGVEGSVAYGDLFEEVLSGIFDLHWEHEEEAFFDRGLHVPDGQLVEEVVMRCRNGASTLPLAPKLRRTRLCCRNGQTRGQPVASPEGNPRRRSILRPPNSPG